MITATQYTRTYEAARKILRDESERIARSGETRAWLMKNLADGDAEELLTVAVNCISNMIGDGTLLKALGRRQHE